MRRLKALIVLAGALGWGSGAAVTGEILHHRLHVALDPAAHTLRAVDEITLPPDWPGGGVEFVLHPGLDPACTTPGASLESLGDGSRFRLSLPSGTGSFVLEYGGELYDPLSDEEHYARGFRQTAGLVSEEGAYLSGSSLWYPQFPSWAGRFLSFELTVDLPPGWESVSQGGGPHRNTETEGNRVRWASPEPQDEIFLIAGRFTAYRKPGQVAEAQVYLREPDPALAEKYLGVTDQYLRMYADLIGPYPYPKFALVENFWETGYGMPSFTLLGPRVIRFPFILHSSYPHEILHNWWGNGVFVDYSSGNWCEGLTAYLADHLINEGRGTADEYRQTTLQKYVDYAARGRDFPLRAFSARHSSATEAVGYGKALMLFHMLRLRLGDEAFVTGLRRFYRDWRFKTASFDAFRRSLEEASGEDLRAIFAQWVDRTGAPELALGRAESHREGEAWLLELALEQRQEAAPYRLGVPVAVTLEGEEEAYQTTLRVERLRTHAVLKLDRRPLRVDVDPELDVFRRLSPLEVPPALSGAFGAEKVMVVLPAAAPPELLAGYRALAESWAANQPGEWELRTDAEIGALPPDRAVWLFGWENRFRATIAAAVSLQGVELELDRLELPSMEVPRVDHSAVLAVRHPEDPGLTVAWLAADGVEPLPGLGRKLPHYHKYSYLVFEGGAPDNIAKGRWAVLGSPMTAFLVSSHPERGALRAREPLAELPPAFSTERLEEDVRFLAQPALEGRGFGTEGLERAAEYIAGVFEAVGLEPGGDQGTFFQAFPARGGEPEEEEQLRNVVGVLRGTASSYADQSVVVGAHYDHLGRGWPQDRAEHVGEIHHGADDNASGVAALLELARVLAGEGAPERTVVFVAFAGEEAGRLGSRHYVSAEGPRPTEGILGMVNLDTVGRLGNGKLLVLGTGTAREWVHVFNGAGFVTGVKVEGVQRDVGGSDQVSFIEAGIPAVQLFTGPHLDYHRPSDTADKVDLEGLAGVAAVAREAVVYLAGRDGPLTSTLGGETAASGEEGRSGRKVSLGTVPDFTYQGSGVRLSGVSPASPAERAGLGEGDVILSLDGEPVGDLKAFSGALKALEAGRKIRVRFLRGEEEREVEATLEAR